MKIVTDNKSRVPIWKYRGYTVAIRTVKGKVPRSLALRREIGNLKNDDEIVQFVVDQIKAQSKLDHKRPGFYSAISTKLHFHCDEFFGNHRDFVLCNYWEIVTHLFAPAIALPQQRIIPYPGARALAFESVLTGIRANISSLHPAHRQFRRLFLDPSNAWIPSVTEIFKGLEYLSKLYFLKNHQVRARKTFVDFIGLCSSLTPDLRDALWEFRCGVVHHGTLYNHTSRGVFRFGVRTLGPAQPAIEEDRNSPLDFVEGSKYLINIRGLHELMEVAQRFVFDDMAMNIRKYVLSDDFHVWIGRSWTIQYIPSMAEMRKFQDDPVTGYPMVDPASAETSRQMAEVVIVEYEDYVWSRYIGTRFPRLHEVLAQLLRGNKRGWVQIPKDP